MKEQLLENEVALGGAFAPGRDEAEARKTNPNQRELERQTDAIFYLAVKTLGDIYGLDVRDAILAGRVRLSTGQLTELATAATYFPKEMSLVGDLIRGGNTRILKSFATAR